MSDQEPQRNDEQEQNVDLPTVGSPTNADLVEASISSENGVPVEAGEPVYLEEAHEEAILLEDGHSPVPSKMPIGRQLVVISIIMLGVFGLGSLPYMAAYLEDARESQIAKPPIEEEVGEREQKEIKDPFSELRIAAQSAIVFDIKNQAVVYEKSPDVSRPLASITKLMTALVAHEIVDKGLVVPITKEALEQSGRSGLKVGDRFSIVNLTDLILVSSSNEGSFAVAAAAGAVLDPRDPADAFVRAMNIRAKELGLAKTSFRNPTGLDITESEAGAYGSARDTAKLVEYIFLNYPDLLEETTRADARIDDLEGGVRLVNNTNVVVSAIPGLVGSKTGYTLLSGGNLAIIFNVGVDRPVVVVVLGSTFQGRFSDVLKLVEATREKMAVEE